MSELNERMKRRLKEVFPEVQIEVRFVGDGCFQDINQFERLENFLITRMGELNGLRLAGVRVLQPGDKEVQFLLLKSIDRINIESLWRSFFEE